MRYCWLWLIVLALGACKPGAAPRGRESSVPGASLGATTKAASGDTEGASDVRVGAVADDVQGAIVEVVVDGDVAASVLDAAGRHSGWEGHKIEDIPGCSVSVLESEVAEPTHYEFTWSHGVTGTFRLALKPRTEGGVSIRVRGVSSRSVTCERSASAQLKDDEGASWTIRVDVTKVTCVAELTRNDAR